MNVEVLSVRGLRPEFGKVDRDLWLWFCDATREWEKCHGPRVTKRLVQAKAKLAFEAAGIFNFKASDGWYIRWLKRWRQAAKQNNEPNPISKTASKAQLPKKRAPRRASKAKASPPVILQSSTDTTISRLSLETGPTDHSSRDESDSKFICSVQNLASLQPNHENNRQNSLDFARNHLCQPERPCSDVNLAAAFLPQHYNALSELSTVEIEQRYAPEASSLSNLEDIAWHDLSELSCFERPSFKLTTHQTLEMRSETPRCVSKPVPRLKPTVIGKGKLCELQKSFQTYVLSSSSETNVSFGVLPANQVPSKKMKTNPTNSFLVKNIGSSQGAAIDGALRQKPGDKVNNLHSDLINDVSACGNFTHHDLEDVSVSSDFVNQLNDELSLELNLQYENENLSHQILAKTATSEPLTSNSNFSIDCSMVQPALDTFGGLIPPTATHGGSACAGSICHMSVAESDFSCEESDYISNAVMRSMQEDDFSILNCDHSPFQGTLSVVDENSQPDKVNNLDDGISAALTSEESLVNREHVFYSGGIGSYTKALKGNNNSLMTVTHQDSIKYQPSQREIFVQQETSYMSSHLVNDDHLVPNKVQEEVFCFSPLAEEGDVAKVQDLLQLSCSVGSESSNQLLSSSVDRSQIEEQELSLSSSVAGNMIVDTSDVFQVSSLMGNQDLFQISSSGAVNEYATNQDVCLSSNSNNGSSHSSTCFRSNEVEQDPQKLICSTSQNTNNISNMYFLPRSLECEMDSDIVGHSSLPLNGSVVSIADNTMHLCSLDSQVMSLPEVTVANAESTTVLLRSSSHLHTDQTPSLTALTSPNTYLIRNAPVQELSPNPENIEVSAPSSTHSPCSTESIFSYSAVDQEQSSTGLMNCESTKENGFAAYDLQLVESVLSEQDDAPNNPFKAPKKTATCLTEKGSNTSKIKSGAEKDQSCYRRSSGDRYFPYFKEKVVEYALKHTAKEAASYFGVNVNTVTIWTRGKTEVDSVVKNYPDQIMLRWLKKSRESGIILTREQVAERAIQLLKTPGNWVKDKSRWFYVWACRLRDDEERRNRLKNNVKETPKAPLDCGDKKALYPDDLKIEVVLYAEQTSKNLAATVFNIARKRVFEWSTFLKAHEVNTMKINQLNQLPSDSAKHIQINDVQSTLGFIKLTTASTSKLKLNSKSFGRGVTSVAVDQELWDWFCKQTAKKNKPKSKEIRAKAVELFRAHNYDKIQCSHGWLKKWSLRYGIALRHEGDSDLLAWCLEQFDRNRNIPHRELVNYAQEVLNGTHKSEFKGSAGWLVRFCKRHRNLLSAKPGIEVEIPSVLRQSTSEFRSHTQKLIHSSNMPLSNVGCMDELPLNLTSGSSRSRLLLRQSSLENCHATVILSCLANGELLPPAVIFKGEGPSETLTFGDVSLLVFYQQDCSMTTAIMQEWLALIWARHVTCPSVLIADCYDPHCPEPVQDACKAAEVTLAIMPAGCSLKLQPLDLAISRLFEAHIYNRWSRHFSSSDQLSSCKRTSYSNNADIGGWIAEAYSSLKETRKEAIRRSFLVTGLTSAANGAEDHLIEDPSYVPFSSLFVS